jgi:hypothetical protein
LVAGVAACSDDGSSSPTGSNPAGATVAPGGTTVTGETFAPQTTFMPDCVQMPSAADLSAQVGVPMDLGQVTGSGTCEFLGLNDQSRSVVLSLLVDPNDQAAFLDVQASLGVAVPLNDPALVDAMIGGNSVLYVTTAKGLYSVQTMVTDATPAEQLPLSVAVLKQWLTL